jgi:hypothetical protein
MRSESNTLKGFGIPLTDNFHGYYISFHGNRITKGTGCIPP